MLANGVVLVAAVQGTLVVGVVLGDVPVGLADVLVEQLGALDVEEKALAFRSTVRQRLSWPVRRYRGRVSSTSRLSMILYPSDRNARAAPGLPESGRGHRIRKRRSSPSSQALTLASYRPGLCSRSRHRYAAGMPSLSAIPWSHKSFGCRYRWSSSPRLGRGRAPCPPRPAGLLRRRLRPPVPRCRPYGR
jgi:hypothetical protein